MQNQLQDSNMIILRCPNVDVMKKYQTIFCQPFTIRVVNEGQSSDFVCNWEVDTGTSSMTVFKTKKPKYISERIFMNATMQRMNVIEEYFVQIYPELLLPLSKDAILLDNAGDWDRINNSTWAIIE